jgi:hypothetical protein
MASCQPRAGGTRRGTCHHLLEPRTRRRSTSELQVDAPESGPGQCRSSALSPGYQPEGHTKSPPESASIYDWAVPETCSPNRSPWKCGGTCRRNSAARWSLSTGRQSGARDRAGHTRQQPAASRRCWITPQAGTWSATRVPAWTPATTSMSCYGRYQPRQSARSRAQPMSVWTPWRGHLAHDHTRL